MEWLIKAGEYAGAIAAVVGLGALILYKPVIKPRLDAVLREKAERNRQMQELVSAMGDLRTEVKGLRQEVERLGRESAKRFDRVDDDIGDLQYERLSQAHDFYTDRGWCPSSKKQQLCHMHESYTAKKRNHLSARFQEDLLDLPDKPANH